LTNANYETIIALNLAQSWHKSGTSSVSQQGCACKALINNNGGG